MIYLNIIISFKIIKKILVIVIFLFTKKVFKKKVFSRAKMNKKYILLNFFIF